MAFRSLCFITLDTRPIAQTHEADFTSSSTASMRRQMWAQSSANSMFMWMKRPRSMILKTANMTRVPATNPMRTRQPVLLTAMAVDLVAGAIVGIGRGVGVVIGGSTKERVVALKVMIDCFLQN